MKSSAAAHLTAIRRFYVDPQPTYTLQELAALWQLPSDTVDDIYDDELDQHGVVGGDARASFCVTWSKAVATSNTFHLLRPRDVELALGSKLRDFRSDDWRTVPVQLRLPRFALDLIAAGAFRRDGSIAVQVEQFILEQLDDDGASL